MTNQTPKISTLPLSLLALLLITACQDRTSSTSTSPDQGSAESANSNQVAAKAGEIEITMEEVDKLISGQKFDLDQQYFELRKNGALELLTTRLLEPKAKEKGLTLEEYIEAEVKTSIPPITDKQIQQIYDNNKAQLGPLNDAVRKRILGYLEGQTMGRASADYIKDVMEKAGAEFLLTPPEPPFVDVSVDDDPGKGPETAAVTIIEFSDFQCPACRGAAQQVIPAILKEFEGKIRVVFRDFPLSFHQDALPAAVAAECADLQGKFWDMHDLLFANQQRLKPDNLKSYAIQLGLDADEFTTCMKDPKMTEEVKKDILDGQKIGVNATPTFIVNGQMISGADLDTMRRLIKKGLGETS